MTNQDFRMWLEGFMDGKKSFDEGDIALIRRKMDEISEPRVYWYPAPIWPYWNTDTAPVSPYTTCTTTASEYYSTYGPDN